MAIKTIINNTEKEIEQIKNSDGQDIDYVYSRIGDTEVEGEPPISIKSIGGNLTNYRIYGNTVDGESVGDFVMDGNHAGEYKVPVTINDVTTNLYLLEPLKMVGDEAEYIDYAEQKQHRVRKNLLKNTAKDREIDVTFTVNSDGSVTCNGTASATVSSDRIPLSLPAGSYYLNGTPSGGSLSTYHMFVWYYNDEFELIWYNDIGDGVSFTIDNSYDVNVGIEIISGYTCNNLTFYPMIRKADIEDDTYELYIENTELDVTLPALSTIKGTNILSVGTSIQPSNMYIKDNFDYKKVFTATRTIEGIPPLTYKVIEGTLENYRIYGAAGGVGDLDSETGKYLIPVTISGKNIFNKTLTDGYHLASGTGLPAANERRCATLEPVQISGSSLTVSFTAGADIRMMYSLFLNGEIKARRTGIESPFTIDIYNRDSIYIAFYNVTASVTVTAADISDIQMEYAAEATAYEPHTEITAALNLDAPLGTGESVSLADTGVPIRTINGTNILTVGTTVQPSSVEIKGRIK